VTSLHRKVVWVAVLYFAEGFPFGIAVDNFPVYLRTHGASLLQIGFLSLVGLPWTLKVLWSPLVDRYSEKRHWACGCLCCMAAALLLLPLPNPRDPGPWLWALLLIFATASATQDIAIDAYTIGILAPGEEGVANGVRVSAYRIGLIAGGGGLVILSGTLGWTPVLWLAAAVLGTLAMAARYTPPCPPDQQERPPWAPALASWLRRPGAAAIFVFVLTYKLGDAAMGPMVKPFWVDRGLTVEEIGLVSTTLGAVASIAGALAGGALTSRWGIFRALWVLGLAQAGSNLGYAAVAFAGAGRAGIYTASLVESFTGGLGTAAFLAFLMHICDKRNAATQYALISALFGLTRVLAGAASGLGATYLGYGAYFGLTFALAAPAYAFFPWVRSWCRNCPGPSAEAE